MLDFADIEKQAQRQLDMTADIEVSANSRDFSVSAQKNGLLITPTFPSVITWSLETVHKMYQALSIALYPKVTLLPVESFQVIANQTGSLSNGRSIFLPYMIGYPRRLKIANLKQFISQNKNGHKIPLMQNVFLNIDDLVSLGISGESGHGKSWLLRYLMWWFYELSNKNNKCMTVIDVKGSEPVNFANQRQIKALYPQSSNNFNDFLGQVDDELSSVIDLIHQRQQQLIKQPTANFTRFYLIIDEILALGLSNGSKQLVNNISTQLSQIAVMGRQSKVTLIIAGQQLNVKGVVSSELRNQLNCIVSLSQTPAINQLVLPDVDYQNIIIPVDGLPARGLARIPGNFAGGIMPFLAPTYREE